jgi:hypothetical protein
MNERIEKLADEARIKFSAHWAHEGVDTAVITRRDLKEFAELLIQECADYAEYQLQIGGTNADKIKQHFGVK